MTETLARRNWDPGVHRALVEALAAIEARVDDDGARAPLVVFDFDNTCILHDIGEAFGQFLIEEMRYRYDLDAFWALVDDADGGARAEEITRELLGVAPDARREHPLWEEYVFEMSAVYGRRMRRLGKAACYEWAVRLHVGLTVEQMDAWSREAIARELARERVGVERLVGDDGEEVRLHRGIRMFVEIRELLEALVEAGAEIAIFSASNVWTVRAFAERFGVPSERVVGNRVTVVDGLLTDTMVEPILFGPGKVEAIEEFAGRAPWMVFGDSETDYDMMVAAEHTAVLVDHGSEIMREAADTHGWAVQPQAALEAVPAFAPRDEETP
jgi:phosphoserine phosphatase